MAASDRAAWWRIGIGAVIAANSMTVDLAINTSEAEAQTRLLVHLGVLAATAVVVALLGTPLLAGAWRHARQPRLTLEAMFVAGTVMRDPRDAVDLLHDACKALADFRPDDGTKRARCLLHLATHAREADDAQAEKRAAQIIEEAKQAAKEEGDRQLATAQANIVQETNRARESLREQVAALAVAGAEKILRREVDAKTHADLLGQLKAEL